MADNKRGMQKTQDQGFLELVAVEYCICQIKVEALEEGIGSARGCQFILPSTYLSSTRAFILPESRQIIYYRISPDPCS
jgi:hypothetical protein